MWTVGHGARTVDTFLAVLASASIALVVDVRRFPGSRRHPQFGREPLAQSLAAAGVGYEWHGETLGGRRSRRPDTRHTALRHASFVGYADHMDSPQFRSAIDALLVRAAQVRTAVMCAESVWWQCHRRMIADALVMRGAQVTHLMDVDRQQAYRPHPAGRRGSDGWPVYDVSDTLPGL